MGKLRILAVRQWEGCNYPYLLYCLWYLQKERRSINFKLVELRDYPAAKQTGYDVLIYHTFGTADAPQFQNVKDIIPETDNKFFSFKGKKVLFDASDDGKHDAYSRFNDPSIPRIKNAPHESFLEKFNVICSTTYPLSMKPVKLAQKTQKDVAVSYRVNIPGQPCRRREIRKAILEKLRGYDRVPLDLEFVPRDGNYQEYLKRVWISVCPAGHGPGSFRHLQTMQAGALMFSDDSINGIKLLPNADLVDGRDYVSFNLENMHEKLDYLLDNKEEVRRISENGYMKFMAGYAPNVTGEKLYSALNAMG